MRSFGRHTGRGAATAYPVACAVCGVTWARSKMRYDGSGQLVCPDDYGRDAVTLDRLNARVRPLRQKGPSDGLRSLVEDNPQVILGENLELWSMARTGVEWDSNSQVTLIDAMVSDRRYRSHFGPASYARNESPVNISYTGTNGYRSYITLAANTRPHTWLVYRALPTKNPGLMAGMFHTGTAATTGPFGSIAFGYGANFPRCTDGFNVDLLLPTIPFDTNMHLFEVGFAADVDQRNLVDGTAYPTTLTGAISVAVEFDFIINATSSQGGHFYERVVASEPPTTAQRQAMYRYFAREYPELSLA